MRKIHLLCIDPQNDFCTEDDGHGNKGTLVVPGAAADMSRVAKMIRRLGPKLDDISVTLDSHQTVGIERPAWWVRKSDGAQIAPFTCLDIHPDGRRIVRAEFVNGAKVFTEEEYVTKIPSFLHQGGATGKGSFGYLQALKAANRYPHMVWTEHCIPDLAAVEIPSFSGTAEERKDACERFLNELHVNHGERRALEPIDGWTHVDPLTELACLMNKPANSN